MTAGRPTKLTRGYVWVCVLINQCATPGLGSWLGRRRVAGGGQLLLAVTGFLLMTAWLIRFFYGRIAAQLMEKPAPPVTYGWWGKWGLIVFGASWVWAWFPSISLLRET